jgi:hypothetical protein
MGWRPELGGGDGGSRRRRRGESGAAALQRRVHVTAASMTLASVAAVGRHAGRWRAAGPGVLRCCWLCPAAPWLSRPSPSSSIVGVCGGGVAQIYDVVAYSWWAAVWAAMACCWVAILGAYLA